MGWAENITSRFGEGAFEVRDTRVIANVENADFLEAKAALLRLPKDLLIARRIVCDIPSYQRMRIKEFTKGAALTSLESRYHRGYLRRFREPRKLRTKAVLPPKALKDATELTNGVIIKGIRDLLIELKLLRHPQKKKIHFKQAKKLRRKDIDRALRGYKRALNKQLRRSKKYARAKVYRRYDSIPKKREVYYRQRYPSYCEPHSTGI
jgi:hypothetical protein